ncbi:5'-nucleotidase domain-containing protein 1 [Hylaeus anthracinus]|uniref:5'-nucleotidase domain-containing protein 1 n=1 Tax=Hylaeus anthracinus TaxID=313031 RepID=UPI0023B921EB|nr:5'-nucleotidase domain-containing protein 1 [Hylaeus anthracinus]
MIRIQHLLSKSLKSCLKEEITLNFKTCEISRILTYSLTSSVSVKHYCTRMSFAPSMQANTNTLKFLDYDCVGFDLDNTLLRYNVTNLVHLTYETLANYLITEKGYSTKYLSRPLNDKDLDFMQKGLFFDFERGNILRISADGIIHRACHGTSLLSVEEIKEIYCDQKWEATDAFCNDMLSTWNGPVSMKMRSSLDYFDMSSSLVFAKLIDTLDEEQGGPLDVYNVWPDMLDGLIEMYNKDHFKLDKGCFFHGLTKDPVKYLRKCSLETISWIQELKKQRVTFLITGSNIDFVDFTATYALGEDWKSLFDIIICYARKPGFFTDERPFLELTNYQEGDVVESKDLKRGGIYSQGNWKGLVKFLGCLSKKSNPRCIYIGDNLVQDIYVPNARVECDTVAVIEEQMSEGMVHQRLSHPDEKILNSTFWGSYFCLKDSKVNVDSLWGFTIKKYAKLCIPEIDLITQQPLGESYPCFSKDGKNYDGYYPAVPLSISIF